MLVDAKGKRLLSVLCSVVYLISYITRLNFSVIVAEIVEAEGILKSSASFVISAGFISYGIGQLISGFLGDKINPKKIILVGLLATSVCNLLIPFCKTVQLMTAVWVLNGFAQSAMWPPLVKILATYFSKDDFQKSVITVAIGSSTGTILIYLLAPAIIFFSDWKTVFFVSAALGSLYCLVWHYGMKKVDSLVCCDKEDDPKTVVMNSKTGGFALKSAAVSSGLIFIIIGIISQGILKDSITTWMPSFIVETYNLSSSISILSAVILPIFAIICFRAASYLQKNIFKNELTSATVMFLAGLIGVVIFFFFYSSSAIMAILLAGIITGCMHGANLMLISLVPVYFNKFGNVSFISGLLNFFAYAGSALSTYGVAKSSEVLGWQFTIIFWIVIALIGTASCFANVKRWHAFANKA